MRTWGAAALVCAMMALGGCRSAEIPVESAAPDDGAQGEPMRAESKERGPVYFGGWGSYSIPRKPQEPLTKEAALARPTWYEAYYDDQDRLVRFEKYLEGELEWADRYEYGEGQRLKTHILRRSDGTEAVHPYDERGRPIQ